jgi:hypothetical protein
MGVDQARHERRAAAIDNYGTVAWCFLPTFGYALDSVAFDEHFAGEGTTPRAVENLDIRE